VSNEIRCPECGSTNVECVEKPYHNHICHDCGHSLLGDDYPVRVDPFCAADPTPQTDIDT